MENKKSIKNIFYTDLKRFEHEIFLETTELIINSNGILGRKTLFSLGEGELYHIIKFYQKIILTTLYFENSKILFEYHLWLYRVYYNRGIDLDFFTFLRERFYDICGKYLKKESLLKIGELFAKATNQHNHLKQEAVKKRELVDYVEESSKFAECLILGDKQKAYQFFNPYKESLEGFLEFYNGIVANAMKKIGYMWESKEISVAKEHLATNTLESIIFKIIDELESQQKKETHIFLSSAPKELHGLGLQVASSIFEKSGYKVTNIGTNIPAKEIVSAIEEFKPEYVIFSATLQTSLIDIALLIDEVINYKEVFVKPLKIGIAGNAFDTVVQPEKCFKADFYMKRLQAEI